MSERRTRLLTWTVPVVVLSVLLGLSECVLRQLAPMHLAGIQSAYEYDGDLGYRLKPSTHQYLLTDNLQEIRTGRLGNVGFEDDFSRYPNLIFTLGDSYTQGTGNSSDTAYPFQLDLLLNRNAKGFYEERFGVVNLGLAAFGTEQSLRAAKRYGELLGKPAYVLYFGCDNDYDDDVLFRSGYRHRHLVAGSPVWGRLVGPLLWLSDFELVKRAKLAVAELRLARLSKAAEGGAGAPAAAGPPVAEQVWPVVSQIVELARSWNATVVVSWANPYSSSYPWLQRKAAEEGLVFADWVPVVKSVQDRMPDLPYANPHSAGHWRPWTNRIIAESFAREMGLWPATPEGIGGGAQPPAPSAR
jgi:hypothetical protein